MRRPFLVLSLLAAILVILSLSGLLIVLPRITTPTLSESLVESPRPLTLEQARQMDVDFPFPDTAFDIEFRFYSTGWIGFEERVTFHAPAEDCIHTADLFVRRWNDLAGAELHSLQAQEDGSLSAGGGELPQITVDPSAGVLRYYHGD